MRKLSVFVLFFTIFFLHLFLSNATAADESITISTYYPSPYGSYRELRSVRMAIGGTYINQSAACWGVGCGATVIADTTSLIVEGDVGIATANPTSPAPNNQPGNLDVNDIWLRSAGTSGAWISELLGNVIIKPNNEDYVGTSFHDDADLQFSIGANERWQFEIFAMGYEPPSPSGGIKVAIGYPSGSTMLAFPIITFGKDDPDSATDKYSANILSSGTSLPSGLGDRVSSGFEDNNRIYYSVSIRGSVQSPAVSGGIVSFRWAQRELKTNGARILRGSYLIARKVQ